MPGKRTPSSSRDGPDPSVFLTPELVASKQVSKAYDIVTDANKKLVSILNFFSLTLHL